MRDAAFKSLAVGFFDGVHLGHRKILSGASAALTFSNHPLSLLAPDRAPRLIMTPDQRVRAMRACGVDEVFVLDFTPQLAALSPEGFIDYLRKDRGISFATLRCGDNWRFGKGGVGDPELVRKMGFGVEVVPYAEYEGAPVSSTRIRKCLEAGDLVAATAMMGHRLTLAGIRQGGKGFGRTIGYPTVNLRLPTLSLNLPRGVYEVDFNGHRGIANFGLAPTMGERSWKEPVLEVHVLDAETVEAPVEDVISFVRFIRPERTFGSVAELTRQIAEDCRKVVL